MRRSLLLLILFAATFPVLSQTILLKKQQECVFRVPWKPRETGLYSNSNIIVREIAKSTLKEPSKVGIYFSCQIGVAISRTQGQTRLVIGLSDKHVTGDCTFRTFPLEDVLKTSRVALRIRIASREDTSGYSEMALRDLPIHPDDTLLATCSLSSYNPEIDTLLLVSPEFFYDSLALNAFSERLDLINDYYASVAMLDSVNLFSGSVDFADPMRLPYHFFEVSEVNNVIRQIASRNFSGKLLTGGYDPAGLEENCSRERKHALSLTYTLGDHLDLSTVKGWSGDMDSLSTFFVDRILSYVRRSKQMDHLYGKIYQDFLELYEVGDTGRDPVYDLPRLLNNMFPDAAKDTLPGYFLKHLNGAYVGTALGLMGAKRFAEAFTLLAHGRRVTELIKPDLRDTAFDQLQVAAAEGILSSYAGIAATCIQSEMYQMADAYLLKAGEYLSQNRRFIRSDSVYRSVYASLFFKRNSDCDRLLAARQFRDALECYRDFESLYTPREVSIIREQLLEKKREAIRGVAVRQLSDLDRALKDQEHDKSLLIYDSLMILVLDLPEDSPLRHAPDAHAAVIAHIRYQRLFLTGSLAVENGRFTLGVDRLQKARTLADRYRFDPDPDFDSVYRIALRNYLLVRLSGAQRHIWSNDFDSAYYQLRVIRDEATRNHLENEEGLAKAFQRFGQKISDQKCRIHHDSLDLCVIRADRCIALKNYRGAIAYLDDALKLAGQRTDCNTDVRAVRDTLEKYCWAGLYQQRLAEIDSYVAAGAYMEAISRLEENDRLYVSKRIDRAGIGQEGIYEYISRRLNPYLTLEAVTYFTGHGAGKEALRFLHLLKIQNFRADECVKAQELCARTTAREDFYRNPLADPGTQSADYTTNDKWYTVFKKTYLEEWTQLKKVSNQK